MNGLNRFGLGILLLGLWLFGATSNVQIARVIGTVLIVAGFVMLIYEEEE